MAHNSDSLMRFRNLFRLAKKARLKAYAPYSGYKVGAAILADDGKIYTGSNVENASYGLTLCAERTALVKAVSQGNRKFKEVLIVADGPEPVSPCGACRQVLFEFGKSAEVIMSNLKGRSRIEPLSRLLPHGFSRGSLKRK